VFVLEIAAIKYYDEPKDAEIHVIVKKHQVLNEHEVVIAKFHFVILAYSYLLH
jgi:hypothetical protein